MANEYSKIRIADNTKSKFKSKSIDISDLYSPPRTPAVSNPNHPPPSKPTTNVAMNAKTEQDPIPSDMNEADHEDGVGGGSGGERFGVILSRNCSVSSTASYKFRTEKAQQNSNNNNNSAANLQVAVMRAFSMRRSASVSEGYCRIHEYDQSEPFSSSPPSAGDHPPPPTHLSSMQRSRSKSKRRGKILKACRSFFGF